MSANKFNGFFKYDPAPLIADCANGASVSRTADPLNPVGAISYALTMLGAPTPPANGETGCILGIA